VFLGTFEGRAKTPKKALFRALWRDSEGVRREAIRSLWRVRREKESFEGRKAFLALPREL